MREGRTGADRHGGSGIGGCSRCPVGLVGSGGVAPDARRATPTTSNDAPASASGGHAGAVRDPEVGTGRPAAARRRSRPTGPRVVDDPDIDVVCELHRRARARAHADPAGARRTANPSSPRTRSCWPTRATRSSRRPRPPVADVAFEAAVAGGIPLIRPLTESLAGERVERLIGHRERHDELRPDHDVRAAGGTFEEALREAQRLGYAEADPTADVEGSTPPPSARSSRRSRSTRASPPGDVYREGIATHHRAGHRRCGPARLRREARRDRRARRRRGVRSRVPGDDPGDASAGERPRGVQRGVRRGRHGRAADVLRAGAPAATRRRPASSVTSCRWRGTSPSADGPCCPLRVSVAGSVRSAPSSASTT